MEDVRVISVEEVFDDLISKMNITKEEALNKIKDFKKELDKLSENNYDDILRNSHAKAALELKPKVKIATNLGDLLAMVKPDNNKITEDENIPMKPYRRTRLPEELKCQG